MNRIIAKSDKNYNHISEMYNALKKKAKEYDDKSKLGIANWSAEANQGTDVINYMLYDGGYSSNLNSMVFGFRIWQTYDNTNGTCFRFEKGSIEDMEKCLDEIKKEL